MRKRNKLIGLVTLSLSSLVAAPALAVTTEDEGYSYEFEDDDLLGEAFGADGDLIVLRAAPARTLLLRPRTSFVREIIESIEEL